MDNKNSIDIFMLESFGEINQFVDKAQEQQEEMDLLKEF